MKLPTVFYNTTLVVWSTGSAIGNAWRKKCESYGIWTVLWSSYRTMDLAQDYSRFNSLVFECVFSSFVCEWVCLCVEEVKSDLILQLNDVTLASSPTAGVREGMEVRRRNRGGDRIGQGRRNLKMFLWKVRFYLQVMQVMSWLEIWGRHNQEQKIPALGNRQENSKLFSFVILHVQKRELRNSKESFIKQILF